MAATEQKRAIVADEITGNARRKKNDMSAYWSATKRTGSATIANAKLINDTSLFIADATKIDDEIEIVGYKNAVQQSGSKLATDTSDPPSKSSEDTHPVAHDPPVESTKKSTASKKTTVTAKATPNGQTSRSVKKKTIYEILPITEQIYPNFDCRRPAVKDIKNCI